MVQIGIPLQSREMYGRPQWFPLFEHAANRGLPVAIHVETGTGINLPPTPSGHPRTYEHYATFMPLNYIYHLMNMIAEGLFESLPDLKVVWADGGAEMVTPFMWRMDTFGRPHLELTPWAPQIPSAYLADHVRFVQSNLDGPSDPEIAAEWIGDDRQVRPDHVRLELSALEHGRGEHALAGPDRRAAREDPVEERR